MVHALTKITKNWMIFLPDKVRDILNCKRGDFIIFYFDKNKITIETKREEDIRFE